MYIFGSLYVIVRENYIFGNLYVIVGENYNIW
jgi:hypothetical protein